MNRLIDYVTFENRKRQYVTLGLLTSHGTTVIAEQPKALGSMIRTGKKKKRSNHAFKGVSNVPL